MIKAVKFDDVSAVKKLLSQGVDPNLVDNTGTPLLVIAAREKSDKVGKLLADNPNIDLEKLDPAGENAMMLAALNDDLTFVNMLIAKDAEVNKKGWTPLHYAATNGHDDVVKVLLDHSAYIDAGLAERHHAADDGGARRPSVDGQAAARRRRRLAGEEPDWPDGGGLREAVSRERRGGRAGGAAGIDAKPGRSGRVRSPANRRKQCKMTLSRGEDRKIKPVSSARNEGYREIYEEQRVKPGNAGSRIARAGNTGAR